MRRIVLFSCLVAGLIGCGKKKPPAETDSPDPPPARGPKGDTPKTDTGTGKSKDVEPQDTAKVLSPRAAFKTGHRRKPGDSNSVLLSADGTRLAVGLAEAKKTQIWDISGEPKKLNEFPGVARQFSSDGKRFLRSDKIFDPTVVSAETGAVIKTLPYPGRNYDFRTPDVVVGVWRGDPAVAEKPKYPEVREYDVSSGRPTTSFVIPSDFGTPLIDLSVQLGLNDGREVAIGGRKSGRVEVWDVSTQKRVRELTLAGTRPSGEAWGLVGDLRFSPDGKWVAYDPGKGVEIADGRTGAPVAPRRGGLAGRFVPGRDVYMSKVSKPDAKLQTLSGFEAFDINRKAAVAILPSTGVKIEFSADGAVAVTENDDGELRVWDLTQLP